MALSKSDKSGSNVTNLNEARKSRANSANRPNLEDPTSLGVDDKPHLAQTSKDADSHDNNPTNVKQKVSNRRFDKVKVERIKAEIVRGEYEIDFLHVADKFIEHERYS